jgi:hypothetical protein
MGRAGEVLHFRSKVHRKGFCTSLCAYTRASNSMLRVVPVLAVCRASVPFALLNASVAASQVVAAPLAAALLRLDGVAGLAGWQ